MTRKVLHSVLKFVLIRALDYYYLIDLYGNVPFVDENTGIGTYVPERITRANLRIPI